MLTLEDIVRDVARGICLADAKKPVAVNQRSKEQFKPGIGPHTESKTIDLVMAELKTQHGDRYGSFSVGVPYVALARQKCDLCLGLAPSWEWIIEVKMLRMLGDNGQPNDNILMHILSPYPEHRSALTDCTKLLRSGLSGRKAILIYGYDSEHWPLEPAISAFELLARARARLSARSTVRFEKLVHPVHQSGAVFGWELESNVE